MIEKIKAIRNPLTVVAIFAAIAEIAGTFALATVGESLRPLFVWFVMLFPVLLVVLFFLTWNFNPKVLYAPSDFRDEAHFVKVISGPHDAGGQSQIEITRQTIEQAIRELSDRGIGFFDLSSLDLPMPAFGQRLREFMRTLGRRAFELFPGDTLQSLWFEIHKGIILVVFDYNEQKLPAGAPSRSAFITQGIRKCSDSVSLEVIGTDIAGDDGSVVAEAVAQRAYRFFEAAKASKDSK